MGVDVKKTASGKFLEKSDLLQELRLVESFSIHPFDSVSRHFLRLIFLQKVCLLRKKSFRKSMSENLLR